MNRNEYEGTCAPMQNQPYTKSYWFCFFGISRHFFFFFLTKELSVFGTGRLFVREMSFRKKLNKFDVYLFLFFYFFFAVGGGRPAAGGAWCSSVRRARQQGQKYWSFRFCLHARRIQSFSGPLVLFGYRCRSELTSSSSSSGPTRVHQQRTAANVVVTVPRPQRKPANNNNNSNNAVVWTGRKNRTTTSSPYRDAINRTPPPPPHQI